MQLVEEYIKKEDFQMKGPPRIIKEKRLEQEERERERERSVHPCARTSSSGEIVKNHLYT